MTITYLVDGVPLDDPDGRWALQEETQFGTGVSRAGSGVSVPGMDGSLPGGDSTVGSSSLALTMDVTGVTTGDLSRNVSALKALLSAASMTVTRVVDGEEFTAEAEGDSVSVPEFSSSANMCRFTVTLHLPVAVWRGQSAPWNVAAPASGTVYPVTTLDGSTTPVDDALVLIDGPVVNPQMSCGSGWFRLGLTLAAGEAALVDCRAWSVRAGAGVTLVGGGTVKTGVLTTSGGPYLLRLRPSMVGTDPTVTQVQVALTFDSGTPSLSVQASPAFLA